MANSIKLNFINQSNDQNNSEVVIFQKNESTSYDELAVAWQVIQNCGQGDNHPFEYPFAIAVCASDSYGNYTPQLPAQQGQSFQMVKTNSGDQLQLNGNAGNPSEVDMVNNLAQGAINAMVYRAGKLAAIKTNVAPGQKAVFAFTPTIYIGVVSEIEEGQVMNSAILSTINTQISLLGISSADIVMTGGGVGSSATPFQFTLQNVRMA